MSGFDWSLCRTFLCVLETGSLSAASRRLDVAQPTVRRHIEALESTLGSPLFVRASNGLFPTDLAHMLRPRAQAMADEAAAFLRTADGTEGEGGTVRITASCVVATEVLPPILAGLRAVRPEIGVEIVASDAMQNLLHRGADIAVRMVAPSQGDVVARRLSPIPLGLFATADWIERHGAPATIGAAVAARALIGMDEDGSMIAALAAMGIAAAPGDFALRSDDTRLHLAAARAGLGVAIVQVPLARSGLRRVVPDFELQLPVWLAIAPGLQRNPVVRSTADALAEGLLAYVEG